MGAPHSCTRPTPAVTIRICPAGCECHAVRAPGSNVTDPPLARAGLIAWKSISTRAVPVKFSAGAGLMGRVPARVMTSVCASVDGKASHAIVVSIAAKRFISGLA